MTIQKSQTQTIVLTPAEVAEAIVDSLSRKYKREFKGINTGNISVQFEGTPALLEGNHTPVELALTVCTLVLPPINEVIEPAPPAA